MLLLIDNICVNHYSISGQTFATGDSQTRHLEQIFATGDRLFRLSREFNTLFITMINIINKHQIIFMP